MQIKPNDETRTVRTLSHRRKKIFAVFHISPKLRKMFFKLILSRLLNITARVALTEMPFNSISGDEMEI